MDFEISEKNISGKTAVLTLRGRINAVSAPQLKDRLKQLVDGGTVELILDLGGVTFMDSSGLAVLVSGLKAARERSGWLKLAGLNEQVAGIFKMTLLDRVFELYPNVDAALW